MSRLAVWRLQATWDEAGHSTAGKVAPVTYATPAETVEGRQDWARTRATTLAGELIAAAPDGARFNVELTVSPGFDYGSGFVPHGESTSVRYGEQVQAPAAVDVADLGGLRAELARFAKQTEWNQQ